MFYYSFLLLFSYFLLIKTCRYNFKYDKNYYSYIIYKENVNLTASYISQPIVVNIYDKLPSGLNYNNTNGNIYGFPYEIINNKSISIFAHYSDEICEFILYFDSIFFIILYSLW